LSLTVVVHVPVTANVFMGSAYVNPTGAIRERLTDLRAQAADEAWARDDRAELHCEACDYWTTVGELEVALGATR
jgi:hypothetical protein